MGDNYKIPSGFTLDKKDSKVPKGFQATVKTDAMDLGKPKKERKKKEKDWIPEGFRL